MVVGTELAREIFFSYRSSEMRYPQLEFAENPVKFPNEVAVRISMVPTMEPPQPQEEFEVLEDEEPEITELSSGKDLLFIFIIDRSGSMWNDRIISARKALELFIRSLPTGSHFSIISFGSGYHFTHGPKGESIIPYTQESCNKAIEEVKTFEADCGGTEIYRPI